MNFSCEQSTLRKPLVEKRMISEYVVVVSITYLWRFRCILDHEFFMQRRNLGETTSWETYGITVHCRGFIYVFMMFSLSTWPRFFNANKEILSKKLHSCFNQLNKLVRTSPFLKSHPLDWTCKRHPYDVQQVIWLSHARSTGVHWRKASQITETSTQHVFSTSFYLTPVLERLL